MSDTSNSTTPSTSSSASPSPAPSGSQPAAVASQGDSSPKNGKIPDPKRDHRIISAVNLTVLVLAVMLVVYISVDTFMGIPYLSNHYYMTFQFWVCVIFMASFFVEMHFAPDKWRYVRRRWLFLLLSVPYLNIISLIHFHPDAQTLYFLRFIPLARGGLAIAIIVGYFARHRITGVFVTYTSILVLVVYFCSLIIFEREQPVNPQIPDFSSALWFACMVVTTIGCYIAPVTIAGKVLQIVLATMGMIMFPLFTVYITSTVIRIRQRNAAKAAALSSDSSETNSESKTASDSN